MLFSVMAISAIDTAWRFSTLRLAAPGKGPSPVFEHVIVAEDILRKGMHEGDKVAIIGDGTGAYWARLAKVRIVAEVMAAHHDAQRFWQSSEETQAGIMRTFAASGVKAVVADNPPASLGSAWIHIPNTRYYLRFL